MCLLFGQPHIYGSTTKQLLHITYPIHLLKLGKVARTRKKRSTASTDSLSTAEILGIVERLKTQRYRDSTRNTYCRIWKVFAKFYLRLDVKPEDWENKIILFIGFLVDCELQSSTIRTYHSAIKGILAESGIQLNEDTFLLNSLTWACRLRNDQVIHRLPIHKQLHNLILAKVEDNFGEKQQPYLIKLYKVMFTAAYYGLLRAGEITKSPHVLKAKDVFTGKNKPKILFILWTSKTHDRSTKLQMIKITGSSYQLNKFCPFQIISDYIKVRPDAISTEEQFFVYPDGSPVTANKLREILKLMLKEANIKNDLFNLHSYRIGRCSDLFKLGLSVETIKKIGRWKSNAVFAYLRD